MFVPYIVQGALMMKKEIENPAQYEWGPNNCATLRGVDRINMKCYRAQKKSQCILTVARL